MFASTFHVVWCPKYRRLELTGAVAAPLKEMLTEVADEHAMTMHAMEVMADHVPLFIEADPTLCVALSPDGAAAAIVSSADEMAGCAGLCSPLRLLQHCGSPNRNNE